MNLGQNSVTPQFEGGGVKGLKTQKSSLFSESIENQKLYNITKNTPPKSNRRKDIGDFPLFDLEKKAVFPHLSSKLS